VTEFVPIGRWFVANAFISPFKTQTILIKGDGFLWAVFLKNTKVLQIFWILFQRLKLNINFGKKWSGPHFWAILDKLVWSLERCQ
jgi:hypothetical protein